MQKTSVLIVLVLMCGLLSFRGEQGVRFTVPKGWPQPAYDFNRHPLTEAKIALGRRLFNDPILSKDNTISCSSCHLQYTAFTHIDHNLSHGIQGRIGTRNSIALMNLAWSSSFMWDGNIKHLDEQAQAPISNPLEMDETMDHVATKLNSNRQYRALWYEAFGDSIITAKATMQALSQFMLTLVSANAKYDRVMAGTEHFSPREEHGYALFKTNCASCHTEPLFTNGQFENNGLAIDSELADKGRMKITHKSRDARRFKVPTLRNVEVTYPYMHDGRFRNLQMVLFHYTEQVQQSPTLSAQLRNKVVLSEQDKNDIIIFLKTLTDEDFLRNKAYTYLPQVANN
jgi:cytochrome c peroxidase